ncbi:sulfite exporter TauE/SafE family protein [Palaeococcus sp. (in: euryarchaeotes)]
MKTLLIALLSFGGGFIGSMMSGGSMIIFSILTFAGLPIKEATGTLKVVIAALTFVSTLTYFKGGVLDVKLAPLLTISSIFGAFLGSSFFLCLSRELANFVAAALLLVGIYFTIRFSSDFGEEPKRKSRIEISIIGLLIGIYIGILGIASTLIVISALKVFFRLDMLKANGTAKMVIFLNNAIAAVNYGLQGSVDYSMMWLILIPVVAGSWLGAKSALKMGSKRLRVVFIIIGILTLLKILIQ